MRPAVLLALCSLVLFGSGCKSQCRQLSEKLCECTTSATERTSCLSTAANKETRVALTAEDEARCEALIPLCDCRLLDTPEGKAKCGYAEPSDGGY